jgi:hypothetical protein
LLFLRAMLAGMSQPQCWQAGGLRPSLIDGALINSGCC